MSIIAGPTTSFKVQLLNAVHDFSSHTFKLALYSSSASLGPDTTIYTTSGEVTGTNYTAGGAEIVPVAPTSANNVAIVDFDDVTFSNVTLTARGGLIYNVTATNKAVWVLDFGLDRVKTAADLVIRMPIPDYIEALIRIK